MAELTESNQWATIPIHFNNGAVMPKTLSVERYPEVYSELVKATITSREPTRVPNETKAQAETLRGKMYAFIRACEKELRNGDKTEYVTRRLGLSMPDVTQITFRIEGNDLVLLRKDSTPEALRIQAALDQLGLKPKVAQDAPSVEDVLKKVSGEYY